MYHNFIIEVATMKRRNFLKTLLLGIILLLFGKKAEAEKKPENHLTMAMFWRKVD
jgi:hypothetical protein